MDYLVTQAFAPAVQVGNRERGRRESEVDLDIVRQRELNRIWRSMLRSHPWMIKLMTHVRFLVVAAQLSFAIFLVCGSYLPPDHPALTGILFFWGMTLPYWCWVGGWHHRIEQRVFEDFRARFGVHYHLY